MLMQPEQYAEVRGGVGADPPTGVSLFVHCGVIHPSIHCSVHAANAVSSVAAVYSVVPYLLWAYNIHDLSRACWGETYGIGGGEGLQQLQ